MHVKTECFYRCSAAQSVGRSVRRSVSQSVGQSISNLQLVKVSGNPEFAVAMLTVRGVKEGWTTQAPY